MAQYKLSGPKQSLGFGIILPGEGRWRLMWNSVSCDPQTVRLHVSLYYRESLVKEVTTSSPEGCRISSSPCPGSPSSPSVPGPRGPAVRRGRARALPLPLPSVSAARGPRSCPMCWSAACCCGWLRTGFTPSACARAACTGRARWPRTQTKPNKAGERADLQAEGHAAVPLRLRDLTQPPAGTESAALQPRRGFWRSHDSFVSSLKSNMIKLHLIHLIRTFCTESWTVNIQQKIHFQIHFKIYRFYYTVQIKSWEM